MRNYLNFICPTDYLESLISNTFKGEHYFFTSLGNSMKFDKDMLEEIKELLEVKNIREISFVLSDDNRIVLDALGDRDFEELKGLHSFYDQILREKENSEAYWQAFNPQFLISTYFLNNKIRELKLELSEQFIDEINISAKIYKRKEGIFRNIHSDLIIREYVSLN